MLTPDHPDALKAREEMLRAAIQVLSSERGREDDPHYGASLDLAHEGLALAARDLHLATEALARNERPVGWNTKPHQGRVPVSLTREDLRRLIDALQDSTVRLTKKVAVASQDDQEFIGRIQAKDRDLLERLRQEWAIVERYSATGDSPNA